MIFRPIRRAVSGCWPLALIALYGYLVFVRVPTALYSYHALLSARNDGGCHLPQLDPFDPSIKQYIKTHQEAIRCRSLQPNLFVIRDHSLILDQKVLASLKLSPNDLKKCTYRQLSHDNGVSDDVPKFQDWIPYTAPVRLETDFVEVNCPASFMQFSNGYHRILYHTAPTTGDEKMNGSGSSRGEVPSFSNQKNSEPTSQEEPYGVAVVGIDSMSWSNFVRTLPISRKYLIDALGAIEFKGHVKVGDNTWVNQLAIFSGLFAEGYHADLKPDLDVENYARFFDDYAPYIWRNFSQKGYATLLSEDRPDINTFNYPPKRGFQYTPVDHYMRPYWLAKAQDKISMRSTGFCYNTDLNHNIMLGYLENFMETYQSSGQKSARRPVWGFIWWQELSHEFLNAISSADADLEGFLHRITPFLNNTFLFVLSDHGHRYDAIRQSVIGRIEARMPYLAVVPPRKFAAARPDLVSRLNLNARERLTSQFDVYGSFLDILHGFDTQKWSQAVQMHKARFQRPDRKREIKSLFREIPPDRDCLTAGIPDEYCPCYAETKLSESDPLVVKASVEIVSEVNRILSPVKHLCVDLAVQRVVDAHVFVPSEKVIHDPQVEDQTLPESGYALKYRIQVEASPSGALLEAVVIHDIASDVLAVAGSVDRNNKYGNTSHCVDGDPVRKKYCYCRDLIEKGGGGLK